MLIELLCLLNFIGLGVMVLAHTVAFNDLRRELEDSYRSLSAELQQEREHRWRQSERVAEIAQIIYKLEGRR